jgi:hypothetical protein
MADISLLTHALVRGKTWDVLSETVVAKVYVQFGKAFSFRYTKEGLGKVVPAFGILIGGTLNWTTLEGIVDTADMAYRRRFLIEKYPHLGDDEAVGASPDVGPDVPDDADEAISVVDEIAEAGGPDLR